MAWLEKAADLIKKHEGLRLQAYLDSYGIATIGYGHNLEARGIKRADAIKMTCNVEQAETWLSQDIHVLILPLQMYPFWQICDDTRKAVIIDMAFNLGIASFREFKATIAALNEGKWNTAAEAMRNSMWSRQVGTSARVDIRLMLLGDKSRT